MSDVGPIGPGFRNRQPDFEFASGRTLDSSVMNYAGLSSRWLPPSMANERWNNLSDVAKDELATTIRYRQTPASGIDRGALRMAAEDRDMGVHTLFSEDNVKGAKQFEVKRIIKANGPGSAGIPMPGSNPGNISITEIRTQVGGMGMDKLPNGQPDPRTSAAAFMAYFGRPPEDMPLDPWIGTPKEYHAFPDYLKTLEPRYTTSILMNSVLGYGSWHMGVLCPPKAMTTNVIGTIKWEFNPGLAKRTAFEAPVTVLSHQQKTSKESLIRYGLGIHMELGFWNTELGRWLFARQLEQLSNAIYLTMILMIEFSLYHSPKVDDTLEQVLSRPISEERFWVDIKEEDTRFDVVHKKGGLAGLANTARRLFRQRGISGKMHMVMSETVQQSFDANGFVKGQDDPRPVVDGTHLTVPIRTDKHGETETSRNMFSHGSYVNFDPTDEFWYGGFNGDPKKFTTGQVQFGRYFDGAAGGFDWTSYRHAFRRCCWYDYDADSRQEDGESKGDDPSKRPPNYPLYSNGQSSVVAAGAGNTVAAKGRLATREIGFHLLCPKLFGKSFKPEVTDDLFALAMANSLNGNNAGGSDEMKAELRTEGISPNDVKFATASQLYGEELTRRLRPFCEVPGAAGANVIRPDLAAKGYPTVDAFMDTSLATSKFFDDCMDLNIPVPVPLMDFAPHQLRQAQTICFFIQGHGNMYIGYPMCTMSNDGILATAQLSVWAYFKSVIQKESVVNFHLGMVCGYDRGNDRSIWLYGDLDAYRKFSQTIQGSEINAQSPFKSRFIIGNLPGYKFQDRGTIDISGDFNEYYHKGGRHAGGEVRRLHYQTARIYANYWGWEPCVDKQRVYSIDTLGSPIANTICSRATVLGPPAPGSSAPRMIEGTDLMRHLCWTGAQAIRDGSPGPMPDEATQKIYLERMAVSFGGKFV